MIIHNQWAYNTESLNLKQIDPKAWGIKNCNHLYVTQSKQVLPVIFKVKPGEVVKVGMKQNYK